MKRLIELCIENKVNIRFEPRPYDDYIRIVITKGALHRWLCIDRMFYDDEDFIIPLIENAIAELDVNMVAGILRKGEER